MRLALLLVLAAAACSPAAGAGGPRLELDSKIVWKSPWEHFGGFSGLVMQPGGTGFVTISDRGRWVEGTLDREDGQITGVNLTGRGRLREVSGRFVRGESADAEGLAEDARGRYYVSYEVRHRVRRYDSLDGPAVTLPSHPDFARLQPNSGLETLAIDRTGTLYAIPERSGALTRPFPVYRLRGKSWDKPWSIPREGPFLISDADFGPDGDLYVLERDFSWIGFRTRVRRFTPGPDGLANEITLLQTGWGELDNMEGISVWRDGGGDTRVTMISDDNFFPLQRTIIAEYRLVGD